MAEKTSYEDGARVLKPRKAQDPNDEFSQKAAENKKPQSGMGLSRKTGEPGEAERSDQDAGSGRQ